MGWQGGGEGRRHSCTVDERDINHHTPFFLLSVCLIVKHNFHRALLSLPPSLPPSGGPFPFHPQVPYRIFGGGG